MDQNTDENQKRSKRIRDAISSSLISKISSAALQFLAFPLVARKLGPSMFGVYATLTALPGFFIMADIGIGPALAHKLAQGVASNDRHFQARYFKAATAAVTCISIILFLSGSYYLLAHTPADIFGPAYTPYSPTITSGCWIVLVIVSSQVLTSLGAKARAGFQEVHINNIYGTFNNVAVVIALLGIATWHPSISFIIGAVYGFSIIFQVLNFQNLLSKRPYLIRCDNPIVWDDIKTLFADSILYATAVGLLSCQRELGKLLLGRVAGPPQVAELAILLSLMNMAGGFVVMFTGAIWPAIADARARGHTDWLLNLWKKLDRITTIFCVLVGCAIALLGRVGIKLLYGHSFVPSRISMAWVGVYFAVLVMGHVRFTWIMGSGKMKQLAQTAVLEFLCNAVIAFLFRGVLTTELLIAIFTVSHFAFSLVLQGTLVNRLLKSLPGSIAQAGDLPESDPQWESD